MSDTTPEGVQYDALVIEQRGDGEPYITNAPLPEYIELSRKFWEETPVWNPELEWPDTQTQPHVWREAIEHADPDRENDGWQVTFEASNVICTYRVGSVPDDDTAPIRATLSSWSER